MSVHHLSYVLSQSEAQHSDRLVLISLAHHANDDDAAWPSVATMCRETRLGESTVRAALDRLVGAEEITELPERGRSGVKVYRVPQHLQKSEVQNREGSRIEQSGVQNRANGGPESGPKTSVETSIEPSLSEGRLFDSDPVKEVFEHYKATVPGKTDARLSQETRRLIKRALDERPIEKLKEAVTGLASSPHHLGQNDTGTEYLHLKYAIGKVRQSESIGDRIDLMASKAPKTNAKGGTTVDELLRSVPSDRHWIIRDRMSLIIQAARRGERDRGAEEQIRSQGIEPIFEPEEGKLTGWRKVS